MIVDLERDMTMDLLLIGLTLLCFAGALAYVRVCDGL